VDLNKKQVLVIKLMRKWVGSDKKLNKYCKALGQYALDLEASIKDLAKQLFLTRKYLEKRQVLSPSRSQEAGPSTLPQPEVSFEPQTSRVRKQIKEDKDEEVTSPPRKIQEAKKEEERVQVDQAVNDLTKIFDPSTSKEEGASAWDDVIWMRNNEEDVRLTTTSNTTQYGSPILMNLNVQPLSFLKESKLRNPG
jgi:hypothetical protein